MANGLTPKALFDQLKMQFGAADSGATNRAAMVLTNLKLSAEYVYKYVPWRFRHRAVALATVAGVETTELPDDYYREPQAGDWLVEDEEAFYRPRYVDPHLWETEKAVLRQKGVATTGTPRIFTLMNDEDGEPLIYWFPTPTAVLDFVGFQYFIAAPSVDETEDDDAYFPEPLLDICWRMVAVRMCADSLLLPAESVRTLPTWKIAREQLEEARLLYGFRRMARRHRDVYRDSQDLNVPKP